VRGVGFEALPEGVELGSLERGWRASMIH